MELSRREVLAAFLGAPFAFAAGCTKESGRVALPPGELVGPSVSLGHRVREHAALVVPPGRRERTPVAIVGGGAAGLAAAWRLTRAGFDDYTLVELEPELGGTARAGSSRVCRFPWGAHYLPAPLGDNKGLIALLDEMKIIEGTDEHGDPIVKEERLCRDPEERLFHEGRWYEGLYLHEGESDADVKDVAAFRAEIDRWVGWRDTKGRRAFAVPVARSTDDAEVLALDRITMAEWLEKKGLRSARLRWLVDYACRDDYGTFASGTSAWAGLFYFVARVPRPGAQERELITAPEGNGQLVEHLAARAKGRMKTGLVACELVPSGTDAKPAVTILALDAQGQARGIEAERAILAAPRFVAKHVVRPWRDEPPAHLERFEYAPWWVANLVLRERPPSQRGDFPLAWDNVLRESPSLGYVCATHQTEQDHGPTVFTYYFPLCDEDSKAARARLLAASRDDLAAVALADLEAAHPDIRSRTERLDVVRWGHAMVRPRPGLRASGALDAAAKPFRGIHFANTDLSGLALFEEAFHHGVRAAEEVLAARGVAFTPLEGA